MGSMLGSATGRDEPCLDSPAGTPSLLLPPFPACTGIVEGIPSFILVGDAALCIPSAAKSIPSLREPQQLLGTMSLCRWLLQNLKTRRVSFGSSSPGRALLEMLDASGDEQGEEKHSLDGEVWLG